MALKTLGTAGTTTLHALPFYQGGMSTADVAALVAYMKNDVPVLLGNAKGTEGAAGSSLQIGMGLFCYDTGQLFIPGRGALKVLPGDYIAVDGTTGWPVLISGGAAASGAYVHT
jgi:hypothetical protein